MQAFVRQVPRLPFSLRPASTVCPRRPRRRPAPPARQPVRSMAGSATPSAAQERLQAPSPPTYLDVRTPSEFAAGHVPAAVNVPVTLDFTNPLPTFADDVANILAPDAHLLVGCKSGSRSSMAIAILEKAGFRNLTNVDGGFNAWKAANLPVEK